MTVRLSDLPADVRARVEAEARPGPAPTKPRTPRRRPTLGLPVNCSRCGTVCTTEAAQVRCTKTHGAARFEARP